MADGPYLELFEDRAGKWRYRLKAANHKKVMTSGESFASRRNAHRAATLVTNWFADGIWVPILYETDERRKIA